MWDNPSEFVRLALDVVDRQKIPTMKCQSAKLLEDMSDRMDGLMIIVSNVCLEMLNYCILKTGDVSNYPEL